MVVKKLSAALLAICMLTLQVIPIAVAEEFFIETIEPVPENEIEFYQEYFVISAYYSPLLGQNRYVTGSYEGDIRLNGNGTNGADGTPVYPGMIAAPSIYAFGTKLNIPGIGIVAVHDRGGAIVKAGERGYSYDRLDIWMGYGDAGLERALNWGKRTVFVTVYGIAPEIKEQIYLENYSEAEKFITSIIYPTLTFPNDIFYGSSGDKVKEMQRYFMQWDYLEEVTGFYGSSTAQAIFEFQLDYNIVTSPDELGAGHFGVNTRRKVDEIIQTGRSEEAIKLQKGRTLMSKHPDLEDSFPEFSRPLVFGDSGDDVTLLQTELINLGFLRLEPTGFFGQVTEHAVFKFQQSQGLVSSKDDRGAGYVGPATRAALNGIISSRISMKSLIAYERDEIDSGRKSLKMPQNYVAVKEEE